MNSNRASKLSLTRRELWLAGIGTAAIAVVVIFSLPNITQAVAQAPQTAVAQEPSKAGEPSAPMSNVPTSASFEVASIKPNRSGDMRFFISMAPGRFTATGMTTKFLITMAYDVKTFQVSGGPSWINSERYDIEAKEPDSVAQELDKLPREQREALLQSMLQSLLADRFKLKVTRGTKDLPAYALVVAKNGPKLKAAEPIETHADATNGPGGHPRGPMMRMGRGELEGQGVRLSDLAGTLSQQLGRTVLDQTGLKGNYDYTLKWTPEPGVGMMAMGPGGGGPPPGAGGPPPEGAPPPPDASGPSIFTALQEQLGLKLEATKAPAEVLVIDQVERPSEN